MVAHHGFSRHVCKYFSTTNIQLSTPVCEFPACSLFRVFISFCGNFWDLVVTSLQNKHTSAVQSRRNCYEVTALKNIFLKAYRRVYHEMFATLLQKKEDFYGSIARIKSFIYDVLCYKFLGKLLLQLKKDIFLLFYSRITTTYPWNGVT